MSCKKLSELVNLYGPNWQSFVTVSGGPYNSLDNCLETGSCNSCNALCPAELRTYVSLEINGCLTYEEAYSAFINAESWNSITGPINNSEEVFLCDVASFQEAWCVCYDGNGDAFNPPCNNSPYLPYNGSQSPTSGPPNTKHDLMPWLFSSFVCRGGACCGTISGFCVNEGGEQDCINGLSLPANEPGIYHPFEICVECAPGGQPECCPE